MSRKTSYLAKQGTIYDNIQVASPHDPTLILFKCSVKKRDWYLQRQLAQVLNDRTIQLRFEPRGNGRLGASIPD
jgi:hypothetical protein